MFLVLFDSIFLDDRFLLVAICTGGRSTFGSSCSGTATTPLIGCDPRSFLFQNARGRLASDTPRIGEVRIAGRNFVVEVFVVGRRIIQ